MDEASAIFACGFFFYATSIATSTLATEARKSTVCCVKPTHSSVYSARTQRFFCGFAFFCSFFDELAFFEEICLFLRFFSGNFAFFFLESKDFREFFVLKLEISKVFCLKS